jgi:hypothetical protein
MREGESCECGIIKGGVLSKPSDCLICGFFETVRGEATEDSGADPERGGDGESN